MRREPSPQTWPALTLSLLVGMFVFECLTVAQPSQVFGPPADSRRATEIVDSFGLRAVDFSPAADVELMTLTGAARRLSDYQGRWLVVTFFATWCGPCRSEMPSLEQVHRGWASRGVAIVGVSIDRDRAAVSPFLEQLGVTFPTLWDSSGEAARTYHASSIPLTYVIDPSGAVVGLSRGARDWTRLEPMLEALVALDSEYGTGSSWQSASQVELPVTFSPPSAEVRLSPQRVAPGETFELEIDLEWAGEFSDYLPHPPWLDLPPSVELQGISASSSSTRGSNRVRYLVSLVAAEPGEFALDPIELRYTPLAESEPIARRIAGPTIQVASVAPLAGLGWPAAAGGLALVAAGALAWRRRAQQELVHGGAHDMQRAVLKERFEACKRLRLEGRLRDAFLELSELESLLTGGELPAAVEALRYGPNDPAHDELAMLERRVLKQLAARMETPRAKLRSQLKLRDETPLDTGDGGRG